MALSYYKVTSDYKQHKSWPWFQEYLALLETAPPPEDAEVLPVSVGEAYCKWVLDTPEVRDIIYRGFVLQKIEDRQEDALLGLANTYFLLRCGISEKSSSYLNPCWQVLKLILTGDLPNPPHERVRERLLRHSWAFKALENTESE